MDRCFRDRTSDREAFQLSAFLAKRIKLLGSLALMICIAPHLGASELLIIDLSTQKAGDASTISINPKSDATIVVKNRLVDTPYTYDAEVEIGRIDPLTNFRPKGMAIGAQCVEATIHADLALSTTEAELGQKVQGYENAKNCVDIVHQLSTATIAIGAIESNATLTVKISRSNGNASLTWTNIFKTPPRGEWQTSYGFTFLPNRDRDFVSKTTSSTDPKYTIVRRDQRRVADFAAAIIFTWTGQVDRNKEWVFGPMGGLGFDLDNPLVFGGFDLGYNQNLHFLAGVAVQKQTRLRGEYRQGQTIQENLSSDQLTEKTYAPNWFTGLSFRFDTNPFSTTAGSKGKTDASATAQ